MRRKSRKKKLIFTPIFLAGLLITVISVSYAYLSTSLNISGNVSGITNDQNYTITPDSHPDLDITNFTLNRWQESDLYKTQYNFKIVNTGNKRFDNFKVTITFSDVLNSVDVFNYEYSMSSNILVINNNINDLRPNNSLDVGFIVSTRSANIKILSIKLEVMAATDDVGLDKFPIVFTQTGVSGNYTYQYDVNVTNNTGVKINSWRIEIILPTGTTYNSGSNAIFEINGNILIIKNASNNGRLKNNQSTSFTLRLDTDIINFVPSNIKVVVG